MQGKPAQAGNSLSFQKLSRLGKARTREFALQNSFKFGYRNKEDISNLPPNTLVVGSQNVLTNAAEQVTIRNGYTLDGSAGNQNNYGIDSSFDFNTIVNGIQNLRKWGSNLELRYLNPITSVVSWINILATLTATNVVNFTEYWDNTLLKNLLLFVNGDQKVYRWTGAVGSYASSTANTIKLSGTQTLSQLNFDQIGNLVIDGVTYAYTSAGILSTNVYSQSPTSTLQALNTNTFISQLFTTGASATQILTATIGINMSAPTSYVATTVAKFYGILYTDNAGVPGTAIATAAGSIPAPITGNTGPTGSVAVNFTFNQAISTGTNYHFVIQFLSGDGLVTYSVLTGATPAVGTNKSSDAGASWSGINGYLNLTVAENDSNLQTFNGVSPAPAGISVGDAVIQAPSVGTSLVVGMSLPTIDLISTLRNQIYYGSFTSNTVYITNVNSYTDATFSSPRLQGQGAYATIDAAPVAFVPQATSMQISSGKSGWWQVAFILSATLNEAFQINPLQNATNQGAQSQALIAKLKNSIVFVSNEPIINAFGPVKDILGDPNFVNMSDSIKNDIVEYDFSGGSMHYFNYFLYVTVPKMGIERLYNVQKKYWEAPQVVPFSRHYEVDGVLYAHSGITNESYQCYVPELFNDNGNPINAIAAFAYVPQEGGAATELKNFNKFYTEGYIAGNTILSLTVNYDFGGFSGNYSTNINGNNRSPRNIIFNKITDGSLGQNTLGTQPIGSILNLPTNPPNPKFRVINTFSRTNCFEYQVVYSSNDVDQQWTLLRFGPNISAATDLPVKITA